MEPKYNIIDSPAHIDTEEIRTRYYREGYWSTDSSGSQVYHPSVEQIYTCKPKLTENDSFSIGSEFSKINIINITISFEDSHYLYKSGSVKVEDKDVDGFISLDGKMLYVGRVRKAPICDVWTMADEKTVVHIPEGKNEIWLCPLLGSSYSLIREANIYVYYV